MKIKRNRCASALAFTLVLATLIASLASLAVAANATGLDSRNAQAYYNALTAYAQNKETLYADLKDLDADGVAELIAMSASGSGANVTIWKVKNGTVSLSANAAIARMKLGAGIRYLQSGGQSYIYGFSYSGHSPGADEVHTYIGVNGLVEQLYAWRGERENTERFERRGNGTTTAITRTEYEKRLTGYGGSASEKDLDRNIWLLKSNYENAPWTAQNSNSYQETLNQLSSGLISNDHFYDVPFTAYYSEAVAWAVMRDITNGTTDATFSPDDICTTAQILTFLWRASGSPEPTIQNPFADVSAGNYYYKAAVWAAEKKIVSGHTLNGDTPCTRSSTVTYLWRLAGSPSVSRSGFTDVPADASYAQAVAWAVKKGITNGTSEFTFSPYKTCTRGNIVTFLYRYFVR